MIQTHGLKRVREPYIKHLEGRLWEMRMKGNDGIARTVEKTQKAPRRDIETGLRRAENVR